ncbi:hypothetical protein Tco_0230279, partial [Tanacetum coccineum]
GASGNNVEAPTSVPDAVSPTDDFYDSQSVETATADNIYVPKWGVTNGARVDNPALCHNLLDHITLPGYWAMLRNLSPAAFLDAFNINYAHHTFVQQRDAEIAALRTRLEKAECESVDVVSLCGRVSELETGAAVKGQEADTLGKQNAELLSKVSGLESERGELNRHCEHMRKEVVGEAKLREEFKSFQDAEACRF